MLFSHTLDSGQNYAPFFATPGSVNTWDMNLGLADSMDPPLDLVGSSVMFTGVKFHATTSVSTSRATNCRYGRAQVHAQLLEDVASKTSELPIHRSAIHVLEIQAEQKWPQQIVPH
ncbi:hypothetical protein NLI96_g12120 [Meripilus lineatus]|uniref:Uncharacterized protein n=1 Tax=Meripilus lineatus TaxID=2056292 RepID=A0AAD5UQL0_9APHY|nr:hypothetical protein NLI96_g12120 [Physisporinus lineatus]